MNQVADIEFKDCKLTAHACKPMRAMPGRGWLPLESTVAQDAD